LAPHPRCTRALRSIRSGRISLENKGETASGKHALAAVIRQALEPAPTFGTSIDGFFERITLKTCSGLKHAFDITDFDERNKTKADRL
jgi:hypothetical protein